MDPRADEETVLRQRVLAFIDGDSAEEFETLALAAHRYQYRRNPPYRRFADRHGAAAPESWRDIPAVPTAAFKESVLACGPAERVYESSGTTDGPAHRSRHHVCDPGLYRAAALAGFRSAVLPISQRRPFLVAAPERRSHPTSSLGEMVSWLRAVHDRGGPRSFLAPGGLDVDGMVAALDAAHGAPILVVAVTGALLRLTDHARQIGRRWTLPTDSIVLDTGGCKGYSDDLARAEILDRYAERLGVAAAQVVNEYGMTELCSQYYARGTGALAAPRWLRTVVWDPARGCEQERGLPGLLRHVDLANLDSVIAVQTDDIGRAVDDGVELLGRAAAAEPRGCSLLLVD